MCYWTCLWLQYSAFLFGFFCHRYHGTKFTHIWEINENLFMWTLILTRNFHGNLWTVNRIFIVFSISIESKDRGPKKGWLGVRKQSKNKWIVYRIYLPTVPILLHYDWLWKFIFIHIHVCVRTFFDTPFTCCQQNAVYHIYTYLYMASNPLQICLCLYRCKRHFSLDAGQ